MFNPFDVHVFKVTRLDYFPWLSYVFFWSTQTATGPARLLMCCKKKNKWKVGFKWWVMGAEWCCLCNVSCFQFYAVVKSVKALNVGEDRQAEHILCGAVPCIEQPELWGGASSRCPRSSQLSVWLRPHCCRPHRLTVGSFRSPPETPSLLWSHRPCSRSSPLRRPVRPWCQQAGSEPWYWGLGPPLAAVWCFPPVGGAGRCCEVARQGTCNRNGCQMLCQEHVQVEMKDELNNDKGSGFLWDLFNNRFGEGWCSYKFNKDVCAVVSVIFKAKMPKNMIVTGSQMSQIFSWVYKAVKMSLLVAYCWSDKTRHLKTLEWIFSTFFSCLIDHMINW